MDGRHSSGTWCTTAVEARRWVAVIDGSRTLAPREWAEAGDSGRLWMIRPHGADRSAWCADILLRSGAFSLVVLDSRTTALPPGRGPPDEAREGARRRAGDRGRQPRHRQRCPIANPTQEATGHRPQAAGITITIHDSPHVDSDSRFPIPDQCRVTSHESRVTHHHPNRQGRFATVVEVSCAIEMARRLRAHSEVPDRRGVATRNRRGEKIDSPHRRESGRQTSNSRYSDTGHANNRNGTAALSLASEDSGKRTSGGINSSSKARGQRPEARGSTAAESRPSRVTSHDHDSRFTDSRFPTLGRRPDRPERRPPRACGDRGGRTVHIRAGMTVTEADVAIC